MSFTNNFEIKVSYQFCRTNLFSLENLTHKCVETKVDLNPLILVGIYFGSIWKVVELYVKRGDFWDKKVLWNFKSSYLWVYDCVNNLNSVVDLEILKKESQKEF